MEPEVLHVSLCYATPAEEILRALTVAPGIGTRIFLTDWLTFNFAIRDYILADKFEPIMDYPDAATSKANAEAALVNNFMIYAGIGMYLPTKFTYKTPR